MNNYLSTLHFISVRLHLGVTEQDLQNLGKRLDDGRRGGAASLERESGAAAPPRPRPQTASSQVSSPASTS